MRRAYLIFLKLTIVLGLAVIAFEAAAAVYPPLGGAIVWLKSAPGSQCNLVETVNSVAFELRQQKALKQIQPGARIVQREAGMNLWDIPGARQFWVAANADSERVLEAFSEQVANEYWNPAVHIQRGDIVLDVGADYGSVTWQALQSGAKRVIAIEVAPKKWPCLERTFAREIADGRVTLMKAGAWDSESTLELSDDSVVLERGSSKQTVRVTTIDQMVSELHLTRVDFIAMDIEGAEKPALRGAAHTLQKFQPRMAIASEHLPDDVTAIPRTIRTIEPGYEAICGRCIRKDGRLLAGVVWFRLK